MLAKLARRIATLPVLAPDTDPRKTDRTHFRKTDHPIEREAVDMLDGLPDEELSFLVLRYGLTGADPLDAAQICNRLERSLLVTLDIGTGAELRLRNRPRSAELLAQLAALEMGPLSDHVRDRLRFPPSRRWRESRAWLLTRRPIRRLALDVVMEGGVGALIARAEALHLEGAGAEPCQGAESALRKT
jgi:hypothetical protein